MAYKGRSRWHGVVINGAAKGRHSASAWQMRLAEDGADVGIWGTNPTKTRQCRREAEKATAQGHTQTRRCRRAEEVSRLCENMKVIGVMSTICVATRGPVSGRGRVDPGDGLRGMVAAAQVNLGRRVRNFQAAARHNGRGGRGGFAGGDGQHRGDFGRARPLQHYGAAKGGVHRHGALRSPFELAGLQDNGQFDPAGRIRPK